MNININGKMINVNFSKRNQLVKNNSSICNSTIVFTNADKVKDEERGYLYYNVNTLRWEFCGLYQINPTITKNLIVLLESPHKSEFSTSGVPIRPANGITGLKIDTIFSHFINNNKNKINSLNINVIYKVYIVNAIQYQTSCYNALNGHPDYDKHWRTIRNNVFKELWKTLAFDALNRINLLMPSIILNCVTGGKNNNSLRTIVEKTVKSNNLFNHPSSW